MKNNKNIVKFLSFLLIFFVFLSTKVFAWGSDNNEPYSGFFTAVPGYTPFRISDPALGREIEFYPVVSFNDMSTQSKININGKYYNNPYKNHKAYYESIGRPYFFYQEYGDFGWYSPWVDNYVISQGVLKVNPKTYIPNPGVIKENLDNSIGNDQSGTAYIINGKKYNNIKKKAVNPNDQSTNYISPHFKILYEPYSGVKGFVGKTAEFRYMGYSEFGTIVNNPYFPADHPNNLNVLQYPWDDPVVPNFNFPTPYDALPQLKADLAKYYLLQNAKTKQPSVFSTGIGGSLSYKINYWKDKFLLGGHPGLTTGIWQGTRDNGMRYRTVVTPGLPKPNLRVNSLVLLDKNRNRLGEYIVDTSSNPPKIIKGYPLYNLTPMSAKLKAGEEYELVVNVKNMMDNIPLTGRAFIKVLLLYDNNAKKIVYELDKNGNPNVNKSNIVDAGRNFGKNETIAFRYKFTLTDAKERIRIIAEIPEDYFKNGDNYILDDDMGHLVFDVLGNNLTLTKIEFLQNGIPTTTPVAGKQYKVRYYVKYTGANSNNPVTFGISNILVKNKDGYRINSVNTLTKTEKLINGQTYIFETNESFYINKPYIYAEGVVTAFNENSQWNTDPNDDFKNHEISAIENLSIKISKVTPNVVYKDKNSGTYVTYQVEYYIDYEFPANKYITTLVSFNMSSSYTNPKTFGNSQYLLLKTGKNGPFTFNTNSVYLPPSASTFNVNFEVAVNPDKKSPTEESNWKDNIDKISTSVVPTNNNNPCPNNVAVHTYNYWTQKYELYKWEGHWEEYDCSYWRCTSYSTYTDEKGNSHSYCSNYEYVKRTCSVCITDKTWYEYPTKYTYERYEIEKVLFKSKQTGNNWIDLVNSVGNIKAGYGFELEIYLRYQTNRLSSEPAQWSGCTSGQLVYPNAVPVYMPTNVYLIMPDGQIISNTTNYGANPLLEVKTQTYSWDDRLIVYRIKSGNTFGVKDTNKLYIDENTADGYYNMTICNEPFSGHPLQWGSQLGVKQTLYDKKTLTIRVLGGYVDDIKTHITQ